MATQVFHFSNTGVSSGQGFYLKEDQSRIFLRNLVVDSNSLISGSNLVYNNGNQTISGIKNFATGIFAPNLVYNTGNQTISGIKTFASRPTVNGTGVLLSGSTPFVLTYGHPRDNTAVGVDVRRYFGPSMDIAPVNQGNNQNRRSRILKDCFLREVLWAAVSRDNIPTPTSAMSGFFKNFGTDPASNTDPGVLVIPAVNLPTSNVIHNYFTGNLNIPVKSGDFVSFYYQTNYPTIPASGFAVSVDAYFYV